MFNSQDALPLPLHPHLDQYKKLAKDLVKAANSSDETLRARTGDWVRNVTQLANLTITPGLPVAIDSWMAQLIEFIRTQKPSGKLTLTKAQFVLARAHGFESWPKFARHLEALARTNSPDSNFERAADAIVTGDIASLNNLLKKNPTLARARSPRQHRATLLHYVSANGIEGYRQKTPANAVEIARLLLDLGSEVDATANLYGGEATTLALVATSIHPEQASVQEELLQLLLDRGAKLDLPDRNLLSDCLANHRPNAARFLATRGAPLDLESAAGLGKLDIVRSYFDKKGSLSGATQLQLQRGFFWACEYGENRVVEFLLDHGASLESQANTGQTALHWAVIGVQLDTIDLLVARGANLESRNSYGSTAFGQALWSAVHSDTKSRYFPVIEALLRAGSQVEANTLLWLNRQKDVSPEEKGRIAALLKRYGATT